MTDENTVENPTSPRGGPPAGAPDKAGTSATASWLAPAALIMLSAVPVIAGAARLTQLGGGAAITPENARFFAVPLPVVLHIIGASLYSVLGAFQFARGLRRRHPRLHRAAGRLLVPCGIAAGLTGLWMTLFYPRPEGDGDLLAGFRLLFGTAMVVFIGLGLAAIRRRDVARHRAWMTRGYAIGVGAGTQALIHLPWVLIFGMPSGTSRALLVAAGWLINLAVAEWVVRSRPASF
ncbi:membrane protein [Planotetraspora silvatica]|uniref:Membrane protein n=1 Tax=Planotetraspora silvatica TaxID=234614 RepID=A0A8J3UV80_9ACTN|nr:DUF2306 domain-containing protein [Planotetraspora silvatica]GII49034.1 membrane protein [Planotetraspora silvatica]